MSQTLVLWNGQRTKTLKTHDLDDWYTLSDQQGAAHHFLSDWFYSHVFHYSGDLWSKNHQDETIFLGDGWFIQLYTGFVHVQLQLCSVHKHQTCDFPLTDYYKTIKTVHAQTQISSLQTQALQKSAHRTNKRSSGSDAQCLRNLEGIWYKRHEEESSFISQ